MSPISSSGEARLAEIVIEDAIAGQACLTPTKLMILKILEKPPSNIPSG